MTTVRGWMKRKLDIKKRKTRLGENFEDLALFEEDLPEAA